jgi:putative PIN family toxin of toxin-antitoxin system
MSQVLQIVVDTNVFVSALRSQEGASYRLLMLLESGRFEVNLSIPLFLEYESVSKRMARQLRLTFQDIDDILDYVVSVANRHRIDYLWRPFLNDPKDDMVLELALAAACDSIVTFNVGHFSGIGQLNMRAQAPQQFLRQIGALS